MSWLIFKITFWVLLVVISIELLFSSYIGHVFTNDAIVIGMVPIPCFLYPHLDILSKYTYLIISCCLSGGADLEMHAHHGHHAIV